MTLNSPNKKKIIIYTDGACKGNPGKGGWGVVIIDNNIKKELSGVCNNTTNNIMEMTAAIEALSYFKTCKNILIFTDSKYVLLGVTEWIYNWKKNNWLNKKKEQIKNKTLWLELDKLNNFHSIDWKWVKAHNGDPGNERADYLASKAAADL
jgi:ribonuclease HI